ncbi:MAG: tyrosine--tRNA ligase [Candidatus Staskawiczbacteria bacterium]|nr:tyrosine--tRNA ligase [Candidatus Staskawiczbacteria bacterium]
MINTDSKKIDEILGRGVAEIIEKESLKNKLLSGKQLRIKFGIDPTAPDLHLGHTVVLRKLKQFQDLGHKIIFLIGDFTATIGDPSGRMSQRQQLSKKEIKKNMKDYTKQASKILDIKKTEIRYNSEWYKKKKAIFLMELSSKITYARVIERDDFQKRIKENSDINMLELLYPILQGYDSVELMCDVELGGTDQKFNLLMGRKVQKRYDLPEQDIVTVPLLEGTDGVKKMSKSIGNYISLNELPVEMYGKIMAIPDGLILKYAELLTGMNNEEIINIPNPRDQKAVLAKEIVRIYYGEKEAQKAEKEFNAVFRDKEKPTDIPVFSTNREVYPILDLLYDSGLAESKNDAKRVIQGGGLKIAGDTITDWRKEIKIKHNMIIKFGKHKFIEIKII